MMFDRKDDLQDRYMRERTGRDLEPPRHYIPSTADYTRAIAHGLGWGLLPAEQSGPLLSDGRVAALEPDGHVDVELYWQQWTLRTPVLDAVAQAVRQAAAAALLP